MQEYYPPPYKSFCNNYLACILLFGAIFFYSCDPPSSSSPPPTYTTTISGEITSPTGDSIAAKVWASTDTANKVTAGAKGNYSLTVKHSGTFQIIAESEDGKYAINPKIIKTTKKAEILNITLQYVTTVSGKIITPAKAKDSSKGSFIADAEVRANGVKAKTNSEGSYELKVKHSGTFTITANYTNPDGNYKKSAPQTVKTTSPTHSLDIPLNYGYTITLSGQVISVKTGDIGFKNGATVTIEVEGVEIKSTTTSGNGNYRITFSHPGTYKATASLDGFKKSYQ